MYLILFSSKGLFAIKSSFIQVFQFTESLSQAKIKEAAAAAACRNISEVQQSKM